MTLSEILPIAQQLTAAEKLRLVRILVEELDSMDSPTVLLEPGHVYHIYTPLEQYGAADALIAAFPDVYMPGPEVAINP